MFSDSCAFCDHLNILYSLRKNVRLVACSRRSDSGALFLVRAPRPCNESLCFGSQTYSHFIQQTVLCSLLGLS